MNIEKWNLLCPECKSKLLEALRTPSGTYIIICRKCRHEFEYIP